MKRAEALERAIEYLRGIGDEETRTVLIRMRDQLRREADRRRDRRQAMMRGEDA